LAPRLAVPAALLTLRRVRTMTGAADIQNRPRRTDDVVHGITAQARERHICPNNALLTVSDKYRVPRRPNGACKKLELAGFSAQ
ncbi:MAG TPA: hypothetical protein VGA09_04150, partial [Candidatus Binatia bacterium]